MPDPWARARSPSYKGGDEGECLAIKSGPENEMRIEEIFHGESIN